MNILYIEHYAGSNEYGMEFRPYYFAKNWVKMGHKVVILASSFSHLRIKNPHVDKSFEEENHEGITYVWIKTNQYSGNNVARVINTFSFLAQIYNATNKIVIKYEPDVVIASSTYPMDTYVAQRICRFSKAALIHEVHDMWPIGPMEMYGLSPNNIFIRYMQRAEDSFCKHSDKIVSILPCNKEYFIKHGMSPDKFVYVPNGVVLEDWESPEELPKEHIEVIKAARDKDKFILAFFGSHTKDYNIDYLIKAAAELTSKKLFLLFVGNGKEKDALISLAKEVGLDEDSYAFTGLIPKKAIPSLLECIDASYVAAAKKRAFRFGIGMNKLFDAMMGGKPILYAVDAPNNFILDYNCGISVEAESVDALVDGLNKMLGLSEEQLKELGGNGREAVLEHFNYPVLSAVFVKAMEEAIEGKANR